jgi:NNP family nitrate/nitrite transporter-like MFS transporter
MREARRQLLLATLAFAISFAAWGLLGALAPLLRRDLGLGPAQVALMVAIPVLLGSIGRIPMGILADRYGGRRVMTALLIFTALPAVGVAASRSYLAILAWAFLLGLAGSSFAVGVAFTSKWFGPEQQGTALGLFGAGNIGQSIAVFFAPRMASALESWRPVVWIFGAASLGWGVVFWMAARDARPGVSRRFGEMIAVLGRAPMAWLFSLFYFVTFGGFVAMGVYLPSLLTSRYGLDLADAGMRAAGFVLLATIARPFGGWLADRLGGPEILVGVYLVATVSALLLVAASFVTFTVGALSFACAVGIGNGAVFKLVPEYFPMETGTVTGLVGAFGGLGGFFPPLVLGLLLQYTGRYTYGFVALAVFTLVCALLSLRLAWSRHAARGLLFRSAAPDQEERHDFRGRQEG